MSRRARKDFSANAIQTEGKFGVPRDPFELEGSVQELVPDGDEEFKRMVQICDHLVGLPTLTQNEKNAVEIYKTQLMTTRIPGLVKNEFLRNFWAWLLGRGPEPLHRPERTPWGRQSLADDPEVAAYVDMFVVKMNEFKMKLALLKVRRPIGIKQVWLYFKYVVNKEPGSRANFLQDWELFSQDFDLARGHAMDEGRNRKYDNPNRDPYMAPALLPQDHRDTRTDGSIGAWNVHEVAPYGSERRRLARENPPDAGALAGWVKRGDFVPVGGGGGGRGGGDGGGGRGGRGGGLAPPSPLRMDPPPPPDDQGSFAPPSPGGARAQPFHDIADAEDKRREEARRYEQRVAREDAEAREFFRDPDAAFRPRGDKDDDPSTPPLPGYPSAVRVGETVASHRKIQQATIATPEISRDDHVRRIGELERDLEATRSRASDLEKAAEAKIFAQLATDEERAKLTELRDESARAEVELAATRARLAGIEEERVRQEGIRAEQVELLKKIHAERTPSPADIANLQGVLNNFANRMAQLEANSVRGVQNPPELAGIRANLEQLNDTIKASIAKAPIADSFDAAARVHAEQEKARVLNEFERYRNDVSATMIALQSQARQRELEAAQRETQLRSEFAQRLEEALNQPEPMDTSTDEVAAVLSASVAGKVPSSIAVPAVSAVKTSVAAVAAEAPAVAKMADLSKVELPPAPANAQLQREARKAAAAAERERMEHARTLRRLNEEAAALARANAEKERLAEESRQAKMRAPVDAEAQQLIAEHDRRLAEKSEEVRAQTVVVQKATKEARKSGPAAANRIQKAEKTAAEAVRADVKRTNQVAKDLRETELRVQKLQAHQAARKEREEAKRAKFRAEQEAQEARRAEYFAPAPPEPIPAPVAAAEVVSEPLPPPPARAETIQEHNARMTEEIEKLNQERLARVAAAPVDTSARAAELVAKAEEERKAEAMLEARAAQMMAEASARREKEAEQKKEAPPEKVEEAVAVPEAAPEVPEEVPAAAEAAEPRYPQRERKSVHESLAGMAGPEKRGAGAVNVKQLAQPVHGGGGAARPQPAIAKGGYRVAEQVGAAEKPPETAEVVKRTIEETEFDASSVGEKIEKMMAAQQEHWNRKEMARADELLREANASLQADLQQMRDYDPEVVRSAPLSVNPDNMDEVLRGLREFGKTLENRTEAVQNPGRNKKAKAAREEPVGVIIH